VVIRAPRLSQSTSTLTPLGDRGFADSALEEGGFEPSVPAIETMVSPELFGPIPFRR
jgi:hypothetical protein